MSAWACYSWPIHPTKRKNCINITRQGIFWIFICCRHEMPCCRNIIHKREKALWKYKIHCLQSETESDCDKQEYIIYTWQYVAYLWICGIDIVNQIHPSWSTARAATHTVCIIGNKRNEWPHMWHYKKQTICKTCGVRHNYLDKENRPTSVKYYNVTFP